MGNINQLKEQECLMFKEWIRKYPEKEHDTIETRLEYIRIYATEHPEFDGEDLYPSNAAYRYYEHRDEWIKISGLHENEFYNLDILQSAIKDMGLKPIPTYEMIVYLWGILKSQSPYIGKSKKRIYKRIEDEVQELVDYMNSNKENMELTVRIGSKTFIYTNSLFIKTLFYTFLESDKNILDLLDETKEKKRVFDYYLIKTLLDTLPKKSPYKGMKQEKGHVQDEQCEQQIVKPKEHKYTQAERNFSLCVSYLVGTININSFDPKFFKIDNNGTFDKLMRDFDGYEIPVISPNQWLSL